MKIKPLTLTEAEYIAYRYAHERLNFKEEPMPDFGSRRKGVLESCLEEPFQTFGSKPLHRTFIERAAVMFYLVTKNHPFENGNKRMAVTLTMAFFFTNKRWLSVSPNVLYEISKKVASSKPHEKDIMIGALIMFFKKYQDSIN